MSFDITLQPLGLNIATPPEGEDRTELEVIVVVGMMLPFDSGQGTPLMVPLGQVRFPMGREIAEKFAESLTTESEKLTKPSNIEVASDLSAASRAAEMERKIRGN